MLATRETCLCARRIYDEKIMHMYELLCTYVKSVVYAVDKDDNASGAY
jgi:hypothetical protein